MIYEKMKEMATDAMKATFKKLKCDERLWSDNSKNS